MLQSGAAAPLRRAGAPHARRVPLLLLVVCVALALLLCMVTMPVRGEDSLDPLPPAAGEPPAPALTTPDADPVATPDPDTDTDNTDSGDSEPPTSPPEETTPETPGGNTDGGDGEGEAPTEGGDDDGGASETPLTWRNATYAGSQEVGVQNIPFSVVCSSAPWSARYAHAVVSSGSSVLLIGGIGWSDPADPSHALRDVWHSPDLGASWTRITEEAPFGVRQGAAAVLVNAAVLLIGGETRLPEATSDVWSSPDVGQSWTRVNSAAFPSRAFHTAAVDITTGTIIVTSGLGLAGAPGGRAGKLLNDVWKSVDGGVTWSQVQVAPFSPRYGATSFWRSGVVCVLGGVAYENGRLEAQDDLWCSEDKGSTWEAVREELPRSVGSRAFANSASYAGLIYVAAGCAGAECARSDAKAQAYGDVWMSADKGDTWAWQESTAAFGARMGAASLLSGGTWLLLGGVSRGVGMNDVYAAELPQGNPSADGGVVGGIIGCALALLVAAFLAQKVLESWQEKQRQKRLRAYHSVGAAADAHQPAEPGHVHIQLHGEHDGQGGGGH